MLAESVAVVKWAAPNIHVTGRTLTNLTFPGFVHFYILPLGNRFGTLQRRLILIHYTLSSVQLCCGDTWLGRGESRKLLTVGLGVTVNLYFRSCCESPLAGCPLINL